MKDKAAAAELEVNIDDILNDMRKDICRVYLKTKGEADISAKQTVDILADIESEVLEQMQ